MIYTKTGDKGQTSLVGGERVPKFHERVEAYGNVDELNSYIGLVRDMSVEEIYKTELTEIQNVLFLIQTELATKEEDILQKLNTVKPIHIEVLEAGIDKISEDLPKIKTFVLPGGTELSSHCQIARCICRRAERQVVRLSVNEELNPFILQYLNRLSDYLFVLARKYLQLQGKNDLLWENKFR